MIDPSTGGMPSVHAPKALTIAASDSSGGAGIQQDQRVIQLQGCWPLFAITGITLQDFSHLYRIESFSPKLLLAQLWNLRDNFRLDAIKIGAICHPDQIDVISEFLEDMKGLPVVLDPVLAPSKGRSFLEGDVVERYARELLPHVTVVTPNIPELGRLSRFPVTGQEEIERAASALFQRFGCAVFVTGGHGTEKRIREFLLCSSGKHEWHKTRETFAYTHGTGCALTSAIACLLARGTSLPEACRKASMSVSILFRFSNGQND